MESRITKESLEALGFEFDRSYPHDQFKTEVYAKGALEVEITYEGEKIVSTELNARHIVGRKIDLIDLNKFVELLEPKSKKLEVIPITLGVKIECPFCKKYTLKNIDPFQTRIDTTCENRACGASLSADMKMTFESTIVYSDE